MYCPESALERDTVFAVDGCAIAVPGGLADLAQDPDQLNNLFAEPTRQADVAGVLPWLNAMKTCGGAWCRWLEDNFNR